MQKFLISYFLKRLLEDVLYLKKKAYRERNNQRRTKSLQTQMRGKKISQDIGEGESQAERATNLEGESQTFVARNSIGLCIHGHPSQGDIMKVSVC